MKCKQKNATRCSKYVNLRIETMVDLKQSQPAWSFEVSSSKQIMSQHLSVRKGDLACFKK